MILGFHSIFGAYGFWLPNDPRGSWSEYVSNYELYRYGPATKVTVRHSVAHAPHDRLARLAAKETLKHPPVHLTGRQALAAANGFRRACTESGYVFHACAILPDHVHLVIGRHDEWHVVLQQVPSPEWYRREGPRLRRRSEERRVGKECRSRWSPYH